MNALEARTELINRLMKSDKHVCIGIIDPADGSLFERIWAVHDEITNCYYCTNAPLVFGCWGMLIKIRPGGEDSCDTARLEDQDDEVRADWRALMDCRKPAEGWWRRFLHGPGDPKEDYSKIDDAGGDIPPQESK